MNKCVMCSGEGKYIATETNEVLCENCCSINENIKERDYPKKAIKFKPKLIQK